MKALYRNQNMGNNEYIGSLVELEVLMVGIHSLVVNFSIGMADVSSFGMMCGVQMNL